MGYRFVGAVERQAEQPHGPDDTGEPGGRPSIAVLPFLNLSDDREQEYFADGIAEDIITGLSRLRWLFVVARNSTYPYKGKAPEVREVARELGVRYVLEGSVRRAGDRLRVTSHLVDASTGATVWADRYDRPAADVFAVQDEITGNVVASLEPQLYAAENQRLQVRPPESLDAWGHVMRAMPQVWTWAEEDSVTALAELRRALAIEPDYARAHSLMAMTYIRGAHMGWVPYADVFGPALEAARRAVERDGEDPWGHLALGFVHMLSRNFRPAVDELGEALWLHPNFALAHTVLGAAYGFGGAGDEGLRHLATGMRLSPRDPHLSMYLSASGLCHFVAGRPAESARPEPARRAVAPTLHLGLAIPGRERRSYRRRPHCRNGTCRSQTPSARPVRRLGRGALSDGSAGTPGGLHRGAEERRTSLATAAAPPPRPLSVRDRSKPLAIRTRRDRLAGA